MNYVLVGSQQLYNKVPVSCDNCAKDSIGYVWHCPNGKNNKHCKGFDLCPDCAVDTSYV